MMNAFSLIILCFPSVDLTTIKLDQAESLGRACTVVRVRIIVSEEPDTSHVQRLGLVVVGIRPDQANDESMRSLILPATKRNADIDIGDEVHAWGRLKVIRHPAWRNVPPWDEIRLECFRH